MDRPTPDTTSDTESGTDRGQTVPASRRNLLAFLIPAVLVVAADLGTKRLVFADQYAWEDWALIEPVTNTGIAWGLGGDYPLLVIGITLLVVPGLIWLFWARIRHRACLAEAIAWGAMIGGALGNAWDRVLFFFELDASVQGVRDFIAIDLGFYRWPTFNLADAALTCGVITVFCIWSFWEHRSGS